jgi:hypothetical protein
MCALTHALQQTEQASGTPIAIASTFPDLAIDAAMIAMLVAKT